MKHFPTLSLNMTSNIYRETNHMHPVLRQRACALTGVPNFLWQSLRKSAECKPEKKLLQNLLSDESYEADSVALWYQALIDFPSQRWPTGPYSHLTGQNL